MLLNLLNPIITQGISDDITDKEVIERYLASQNSHYFDLLYDRYSRKVMAKCISMLKNLKEAEDATQDIFVKVLLKISDFTGKAKFSTWLYSITYNYCIDQIRKRTKDPSILVEDYIEFEDTPEEIEDSILLETNVKQLKVVLDKIPITDKTVLLMKYQDEMTIKDISDAMDKSESAIKMKIKRAKEKFVKTYNQLYKTA